jgi:hypothetical protein
MRIATRIERQATIFLLHVKPEGFVKGARDRKVWHLHSEMINRMDAKGARAF